MSEIKSRSVRSDKIKIMNTLKAKVKRLRNGDGDANDLEGLPTTNLTTNYSTYVVVLVVDIFFFGTKSKSLL